MIDGGMNNGIYYWLFIRGFDIYYDKVQSLNPLNILQQSYKSVRDFNEII